MPASQAGRRGFDSHLPLHPFNSLGKLLQGCTPIHSIYMTRRDRKSTRLNSSHSQISYAVFCLKKKKSATLSRSTAGRGSRGLGQIYADSTQRGNERLTDH